MLLRIALATIITGLAFLAMEWLDPAGPLLVVVGALLGALDVEHRLGLETPQRTDVVATTSAEAPGHRHAA